MNFEESVAVDLQFLLRLPTNLLGQELSQLIPFLCRTQKAKYLCQDPVLFSENSAFSLIIITLFRKQCPHPQRPSNSQLGDRENGTTKVFKLCHAISLATPPPPPPPCPPPTSLLTDKCWVSEDAECQAFTYIYVKSTT